MTQLGGYGPRQIREELRGKIDPAVGRVLVSLAERQEALRHGMLELAKSFDLLARSMAMHTAILEKFRTNEQMYKEARRGGIKVESEQRQDGDEHT